MINELIFRMFIHFSGLDTVAETCRALKRARPVEAGYLLFEPGVEKG